MKEKDIWNFFLLTGNVESYLAYRCIKNLQETEFAKEDEITDDGESNRNNDKNS